MIRPYQSADLETLYSVDQACFPRGIAYSRRTLRWFLSQPDAECLLEDRGGEILAFILTQAFGHEGHIITLDVLPSHRRAGLGSALLAAAETRLAQRGVRTIQLETAHDNHTAIAFWTRHGYRTRGVLKNYYLGRTDALWMEKRVATDAPSARSRPDR